MEKEINKDGETSATACPEVNPRLMSQPAGEHYFLTPTTLDSTSRHERVSNPSYVTVWRVVSHFGCQDTEALIVYFCHTSKILRLLCLYSLANSLVDFPNSPLRPTPKPKYLVTQLSLPSSPSSSSSPRSPHAVSQWLIPCSAP